MTDFFEWLDWMSQQDDPGMSVIIMDDEPDFLQEWEEENAA